MTAGEAAAIATLVDAAIPMRGLDDRYIRKHTGALGDRLILSAYKVRGHEIDATQRLILRQALEAWINAGRPMPG